MMKGEADRAKRDSCGQWKQRRKIELGNRPEAHVLVLSEGKHSQHHDRSLNDGKTNDHEHRHALHHLSPI